MRTALILSVALATSASAEVAATGIDDQLDQCARFSDMIQTAAEARHQYDGLVAAIREIPDRPEIEAFGFDRLFVQKAMLQIERLHGQLTPQQIGEALAVYCVEMAPAANS